MQNGAENIASQHSGRATRRGVLGAAIGLACLGGGAGLAGFLWTRKDIGARLFNPFTLGQFELAAVPGLTRPDGEAVAGFSAADLAGRRSILNFWASWCPGCVEEHALLVDLAARDLAPIFGADVKDEAKHARVSNPTRKSLPCRGRRQPRVSATRARRARRSRDVRDRAGAKDRGRDFRRTRPRRDRGQEFFPRLPKRANAPFKIKNGTVDQ